MTRRTLVLLATAGSAVLMLAALGFQYLGDMPPCAMCYWQRYGHIAAIAAGLVALIAPLAAVVLIGAIAVGSSAGIGVYHAGVEQDWWPGPSTCTAGDIGGLSTDALLDQIMNAPLVRCDEIPWQMLGLSMAGWNALASALLVLVWLAALRAR